MDEHTLKLLEFGRIRHSVSEYCLSDEGREELLVSEPLSVETAVRQLKQSVRILLDALREAPPPSLSFPPVARAAMLISKAGACLELEELYALGLWSKSFQAFSGWVKTCLAQEPPNNRSPEIAGPVADLVARAPDLSEIAKTVFRILTADGELRELPGIREARERIARTHRELAALSDSYFRDPEIRSMLQSGEPTIRDGRTVLALRANFKGRIKGIVHEVSQTGQTIFMEPVDLVEKNNTLVEEEARLQAEIRRVLRETTAALSPRAEILAQSRSVMAGIDGLYARAMHAKNGSYILAADRKAGFVLRRARHPFLGRTAVPIDVELPEEIRTLVVTGPNTGGKTVTLKTIGLFALMNQFGLGLPSAPETAFAVFDSVFADIGDEQSIDQSLSTFSGHMRVIGGIVQGVTERSLVLLDELGSGTDPEEGCAIAMGLLDYFIGSGCLSIATTHHGILKNYGYSREHCLNASMDFDRSSLAPTYRILMGVPGESRALDIAARNGLPAHILEPAASYLSDERTDVAHLIRSLNEKHRKLDDMETERRRRLREAVEKQRKADLASLRLRQKELELKSGGVSELKRLLGESRKTLENLVRELREGGAVVGRTKEVKEFLATLAQSVELQAASLETQRHELDQDLRELEARPQGLEVEISESCVEIDAAAAAGNSGYAAGSGDGQTRETDSTLSVGRKAGKHHAKTAHPAVVKPLAAGDSVWIGAARKPGTLIRPARSGFWLVEMGSLRLTVADSEVARRQDSSRPGDPGVAPTVNYQVELAPREDGGSRRAAFELDLRGMRLAEALEAVEKQIDAASLQNLGIFSIIHGTGEGVLGKGIHHYLRTSPAVADYHFASPEEGGFGKTVVRLK